MESRFDFYRIILPGAVVLALVDIAARVVYATPSLADVLTHTGPNPISAFIEDPFRGVVAAFAVGLVVYMTEPGNTAPQYYDGIPSQRLYNLLREAGVEASPISLYFQAMDELMPEALRDRALLFGAFYRIGLLTVLSLLLAPAVAVVAIGLLLSEPLPAVSPRATSVAAVLIAILAIGMLIYASTYLDSITVRKGQAGGVVWFLVFSLLVSVSIWLNYRLGLSDPQVPPKAVLLAGVIVIALPWWILRLRGPIGPFVRYLLGSVRMRPDKPHNDRQLVLLDLAMVLPTVFGLFMLSDIVSLLQAIVVGALIAVSLLVGRVKKYETRLHGIYRNHRQWLTDNLDSVIALSKRRD